MKAFELEKYDNIATKYDEKYFQISYMQKFRDIFFEGQHIPPTTKQMSLNLKHKISRLQPNQFKNMVALFGNFKDTRVTHLLENELELQMKITFKILSYAYPFHKARILLKRLSRSGYITANFTMSSRYPPEKDSFFIAT